MKTINRREFLKTAATGTGSLLLGPILSACNPAREEPGVMASVSTAVPPQTAAPPQIAAPLAAGNPQQTPTPLPPAPHLVVARGNDPALLVERALAPLGGIEAFVPASAKVVIKPNICVAYHSYEYAATTNPWLVGALVRLAIKAGARSVKVMDFPFGGTADEAYKISGIEEQVLAAGGEMVQMGRYKFTPTQIPLGVSLKKASIYSDILEADVLINVPIAKHHGLSRLTLAMKNLLGVVREREPLHQNLGQNLADLSTRVRSTLTVVDAIRILVNNGPTGGNLNDVRQLNTIIVSPDIVAADSYAATLFGVEPRDLAFIRAGEAAGLGNSDLSSFKIEELVVGG